MAFWISCFYAGSKFKEYGYTPLASWRTPLMFGYNARSPIYPFMKPPYDQDFEESYLHERREKELESEMHLSYRLMQYVHLENP